MMDEKSLREAAGRTGDAYMDALEADFSAAGEQEFSPEFRRKIRSIERRPSPAIYAMQRVASLLLVAVLIGGVWMGVDGDARAVFTGWVKDIWSGSAVYSFAQSAAPDAERVDYALGWVPEGYSLDWTETNGDTTFISYINESKTEYLNFSYTSQPDETVWGFSTPGAEHRTVSVNGHSADLYISHTQNHSSTIVWIDENNAAFSISAYLSVDDLISLAESVKKIK